MYQYQAYDFQIDSALPVLGFRQVEATQAEVAILYGKVDKNLSSEAHCKATYQGEPDRFLFDAPSVARYLVENGQSITIDRAEGVSDEAVSNYLAGSALPALMQQRKLVTLRAGAISTPRGAVLIAGSVGAGKSTLLAALHDRGYPLIADNVAALRLSPKNQIQILPGPPALQLWPDSIQELGEGWRRGDVVNSKLDRISVSVDKFVDEPQFVSRLFVLQTAGVGEVEMKALDPGEAHNHLRHLTYRANFMNVMRLHANQFEMLGRLTRLSSVNSLVRPIDQFSISQLADLVEKSLSKDV